MGQKENIMNKLRITEEMNRQIDNSEYKEIIEEYNEYINELEARHKEENKILIDTILLDFVGWYNPGLDEEAKRDVVDYYKTMRKKIIKTQTNE